MSAFWIAFLSDGQVVRQKELDELETKDTAWRQLLNYLETHPETTITSIQVIVNGIIHNTPTVSKRSEIKNDGEPCNFWCYQKTGLIAYGAEFGKTTHYYGLSYRVGQYRHYTWIDTETGQTFVEICDIDGEYRERLIEDFYKTRTSKNE